MVSRATLAAVRASISTPVWPLHWAVARHTTALSAGNTSKSTATRVRAMGWHKGMRSLVRLAPMMPARRATPSTSPFLAVPDWTNARVAGSMVIRPSATATRSVTALAPTSTMWACPWASKWVNGLEGLLLMETVLCRIFTGKRHHTAMRTPTRTLRPALLACALLCWPMGVGLVQAQGTANHGHTLPSLGDGNDMTLSDERRLDDRIARGIYRDPDYLDDAVLMSYLQGIWQPLVASDRARGGVSPEVFERLAWELMISRERSVNAFALPGGYLGVHLGLIATVATKDELASVLAHELTHVSQRHIARMMTRQSQQLPLMVGAMILGALAASTAKNADIAGAARMGGQAAAAQSQLNFSRDMEREADRIGYGVMTGAGFNGQGFVSMFDKLQQASRLNDDGAFPYLRSHPLTTERVADMRGRLPLETPTPNATPTADPVHPLMAARARVLAEQNVDCLRALAATNKAGTTPETQGTGYRYAGALAAARLRDLPAAETHLQALLQEAPTAVQPMARALVLEALLMTQAQRLAGLDLATLRTEALASSDRSHMLLGARAAVVGGDPRVLQQATERLQTWVAVQPKDALAWQTLARLYQAQNQPVLSARAEAEQRLAQLDAPGALERLKSAQRQASPSNANHFELSILDARVRQVEKLVREQVQDER